MYVQPNVPSWIVCRWNEIIETRWSPELFGCATNRTRRDGSCYFAELLIFYSAAIEVDLNLFKYLVGQQRCLISRRTGFHPEGFGNFVRLKKKTSMAPFSSDNNGLGRRHSGENFIRPLYIVEVSPPRAALPFARQKKNIPGSLGKLTRPLFRGESFHENGEKLTSCIRSKAVVAAHSIFVERMFRLSLDSRFFMVFGVSVFFPFFLTLFFSRPA